MIVGSRPCVSTANQPNSGGFSSYEGVRGIANFRDGGALAFWWCAGYRPAAHTQRFVRISTANPPFRQNLLHPADLVAKGIKE
jgi:hypothetical protein